MNFVFQGNVRCQESIIHNWAGISLQNNFTAFDHDTQNNIVVAGFHNNQVDVDFSPNVLLSGEVGIPNQSLVAKYTQDGVLLWAIEIDPPTLSVPSSFGNIQITDLEIDMNGDILCIGEFLGLCDFDPGNSIFSIESTFGSNAFILKLSSEGDFIWAKTFQGKILSAGNSGLSSSTANGVTMDGLGNVIIGGIFQGNVDFNPGFDEYLSEASTNGTYGGYVVKLNQNGEFLWQKLYNSYYQDAINDVVVDIDNQIYIGGYFYDTLHITSNFVDTLLGSTVSANYHFFNAKLDEQGQELWVTKMTIESGSMNRLRLDQSGNLYVGGQFNNFLGVRFNETNNYFYPYSDPVSGQWGGDGFLVKYTSIGDFEWCHTIGTQSGDRIFDFDILDNGEIILGANVGYFMNEGTVHYDGDPLFQISDPIINECSSYVKLNSTGQPISYSKLEYKATRLGLTLNSSIVALGQVYSTFEFPFDFDPNPNSEYSLTENNNSAFGFIHRLTVFNVDDYSGNIILGPNPTTSNVTIYVKDKPEEMTINLISLTGDVLFVIQNASSIETINLSEYANGIYFIRAYGSDFNTSQKVIKY